MIVKNITETQPLILPKDCARDLKKIKKFLEDVEKNFNKLLRGCIQLTQLTADEMVARPTYKEEFENIRHNVHKVILNTSNMDESNGLESSLSRVTKQKSGNLV